ncbi:hypothetical protein QO209_18755 [Pseudomonas citronellolis]|uniref:hypothetical protein n=1 Tax=Pseudomonas citronellolis TaxID=53408 RepID=UPI0026471F04|nr:hypothetical protein [Pseudomonas citronellolis]MDN6874488.1 hypothetical protein [Pseudomonas citronellolis]
MRQPDLNLDLCTIEAFGGMCVLPDEVVAEWIEAGVLPSRTIAGIRLVDLGRLNAECFNDKVCRPSESVD